MGEKYYSKNILMWKNDRNSVKQINFIRESELFTNSNPNGKMISNGHFYHNAHILDSRPSLMDGRKYWSQPHDTIDSKQTSSKT